MDREMNEPSVVDAVDILHLAAVTIDNRAASRDVEKERSMARCVNAFNAMTGHKLSEADGWLFMQYLKHSRSRGGSFRFDDYLDDVAYSALKAEAASKEQLNDV